MLDALDITYFLSNVLSEILFLKSVFHKTPDNRVAILEFADNESLYWTVHSTVMTNEHRLRKDCNDKTNDITKWITIDQMDPRNRTISCLFDKARSTLNLTRVLENGQLHFSTWFTFTIFPNYDLLLMLCSYSDKKKDFYEMLS